MIREEHKPLLSLPVTEKLELIDELYASISVAEQEELDRQLDAEMERRDLEIERGEVETIPLDQVMRDIEATRRKRR